MDSFHQVSSSTLNNLVGQQVLHRAEKGKFFVKVQLEH